MLIQKLRLQRGWSQEQLADLAGLNTRTIQRIESGQSASTESLKALAAVFEVNFLSLKANAETQVDNPAAEPNQPSAQVTSSLAGISHEEALIYKQVQRLKGFYSHAMIYALVISGLAVINLIVSPHRLWFVFPLLGWGIGLTAHAMRVFSPNLLFSPEWEKRQIAKRLAAINKSNP